MISQDIKANINKIDFELKNLFENVKIEEKTKGSKFYFEIKSNSTFFNINESREWKRVESLVRINKEDLTNNFGFVISYNSASAQKLILPPKAAAAATIASAIAPSKQVVNKRMMMLGRMQSNISE